MYKVKFFDKNRRQYDFCEFALSEGGDLYDKLEEVLYIVQELTPQHRFWKSDLATCGSCIFTYHKCEYQLVSIDRTNISVRDC